MASKHEGVCRLCGQHGPLTFEHVPPKAAFNDRPVVMAAFDSALNIGPDDAIRGSTQQRGMGGYTLCERCNNTTGHWYGSRFVAWCYQGLELLVKSQGHPTLYFIYHLFPLCVIKQILAMMFSVNGEGFRDANPELAQFVLDKERRYLNPKYRIFAYYNYEGRLRSLGVSAALNTIVDPII